MPNPGDPFAYNCEKKIINEPTHRVLTRIEDSEVKTEHFCDGDCLATFEAG